MNVGILVIIGNNISLLEFNKVISKDVLLEWA